MYAYIYIHTHTDIYVTYVELASFGVGSIAFRADGAMAS